MAIAQEIDKRIEKLIEIKNIAFQKGDIRTYNQLWSRIDELKALKAKFTDREGNWLI